MFNEKEMENMTADELIAYIEKEQEEEDKRIKEEQDALRAEFLDPDKIKNQWTEYFTQQNNRLINAAFGRYINK
jgi:uncharacterized membrane protein